MKNTMGYKQGSRASNADSRSAIVEHLNGDVKLGANPSELFVEYKAASPFPHLIFDDLFHRDDLRLFANEIESIEKAGWVYHRSTGVSKTNLRSAVYLGPAGKRHIALLHSAAFLYLLAELTGISHLVPDPYLCGGGYHLLNSGDHFNVHADRNFDHNIGLVRRLVLITYLNDGWQPDYGGQLELWQTDASICVKAIEPNFNTSVLFEVGDRNFHAVRAVTSPARRSRNSFATYFHTSAASDSFFDSRHDSIYAPVLRRTPVTLKGIAREYVIPPGIFRFLRELRPKKA